MTQQNSLTKFFLKNQPKGYIPKHTKNVLDFSFLVNVLGFSPKVKKAIDEIDFSLINQYGDRSSTDLKKKISRWLSVPIDNISLGNGSDELIDLIPRAFVNPGDPVISQTPTFFRVIEGSLKMKAKMVLVKAEEGRGFRLDRKFAEKMILAIKKFQPKLVWLCTPCNPSGEVIAWELIEKIATVTKGAVIVDEVYQEFFDPENKQ